ncbi:MAG: MinD/ParA family protein [Pirellulales bacterium]
MNDQADELRQLALRSGWTRTTATAPEARLVVVASGKAGQGATTAAANLAASLARGGQRTLLVDADLNKPDASTLCRAVEGGTLPDVLAGRRTIHEALQLGPGGIQLLPGRLAARPLPACTPLAQQRLLAGLRTFGAHVDCVVLDVGAGLDDATGRYWQAADAVLVVLSPEPSAVMETYATIKLFSERTSGQVLTLVNRASDEAAAQDIHDRLARSCQRFLGFDTPLAGWLPPDAALPAASADQCVLAADRTAPQLSRAFDAIAVATEAALRAGRRRDPEFTPVRRRPQAA